MKTRIYKVVQRTTKGEETTLVRAANRNAAERHVSTATITAEVCSQEDLVAAVMAGNEIVDAGEGQDENNGGSLD